MPFDDMRLSRSAPLRLESLELRLAPANLAPTVAQPAAAAVNVAARTADLSVLGADDGGEQNLRYYWNVFPAAGLPAPTLTYTAGVDGDHARLTGLKPGGAYTASALILDAGGLSARSLIRFTVPDPNYHPPTVDQPAAAVVNASNTSATLSVLGADDAGEDKLKYTWKVTGPGTATLDYSPGLNGNVASVRVSAPGTYTATALINDTGATPVTSTTTFTIAEVRRPLSVSPPSKTLNVGASFDFDAVYRNQFGAVAAQPQATAWSVVSGPGTVTAAGVFTAPAAPGITVLKATADGHEAFTTVVTRDPGTVPPRTSHTMGEQRVLVVRWAYADSPGTGEAPIDYAAAVKQTDKVDAFFRRESFNKTGLNFTFVPVVVRLDQPKAYYQGLRNFHVEANEAAAKAAALDPSFTASGYDRVWFATTPTNLGATGKAQLGGKYLWIGIGNAAGYSIHEFSHTYGLHHSHADHDIGNHVSAPSKARLGWLAPTDPNGFRNQTVTTGGVYRLYDENNPLAAADGSRSLVVPRVGGSYTLSYSSYGKNQTLWVHHAEQDRLDATPATPEWKDGGIAVGSSYVLPEKTPDGKSVRVTVLSLTAATASTPARMDVKVEFLGPPPANRPPAAVGDRASTTAGTPVTVDVLGNDSDPDGDALTLTAVGAAANGTVAGVAGRAVSTPKAGFTGTDTFAYTAADGKGGTATAVVTVTVAAAPAPAGEVVMDNTSPGVAVTGSWTASTAAGGAVGSNYLHDQNTGKGAKSVLYTPPLPAPGRYEVFLRWTAAGNRATNVPVTVTHDGGATTVVVNQRQNGGAWVSLGTFAMDGVDDAVRIRTDGTDGFVIADAVRFVRRA